MKYPKFSSSDDGPNCLKEIFDFRHERLKKAYTALHSFQPEIAEMIFEMQDHKGILTVWFKNSNYDHTSANYYIKAVWNLANESHVFIDVMPQQS